MLTHIKITAAKPSEKLSKLHDTLGLFLAVKPNGSKLWRVNYRYLGKHKTLHLGLWPTLGLADARAKRDAARKQIAEGFDPSIEKKRARIAAKYAAANTFESVAKEWIEKCEREGLATVTTDKTRWLLAKGGSDDTGAEEFTPAVTARRSLASKDHIILMIDGKPYKMLKRHLSIHGLTPDEYRQRYNLKADYPMVAENYASMRRDLAKKIGLGRKGRSGAAADAPAAAKAPRQPRAKKD